MFYDHNLHWKVWNLILKKRQYVSVIMYQTATTLMTVQADISSIRRIDIKEMSGVIDIKVFT